MRVMKYSDMETAQNSVLVSDKIYEIVRHSLAAGGKIRTHAEKVDEWVFLISGKFTVIVGGKKGKIIELEQEIKGGEVIVLHIPKGEKHALKARSYLSYTVIKGSVR